LFRKAPQKRHTFSFNSSRFLSTVRRHAKCTFQQANAPIEWFRFAA